MMITQKGQLFIWGAHLKIKSCLIRLSCL